MKDSLSNVNVAESVPSDRDEHRQSEGLRWARLAQGPVLAPNVIAGIQERSKRSERAESSEQ